MAQIHTNRKKSFNYKDFKIHTILSFAEVYTNNPEKILLVRYLEDSHLTIREAKEIVDVVYDIAKSGYALAITDVRLQSHSNTEKARKYLSDNKALALLSAHALIVNSLPIRMMTNAFIKKNQPIRPFESFLDIQEAIYWLKSFKN